MVVLLAFLLLVSLVGVAVCALAAREAADDAEPLYVYVQVEDTAAARRGR